MEETSIKLPSTVAPIKNKYDFVININQSDTSSASYYSHCHYVLLSSAPYSHCAHLLLHRWFIEMRGIIIII